MSAPMHDKSLLEVGQVLLRCSHTRTVPSLHACFSPCVVLQVKVRRRGSDKKFVASVLAVGTECDIGELLGLIMLDLSVQEKCCTQQHSGCSSIACMGVQSAHRTISLIIHNTKPPVLHVLLCVCIVSTCPAAMLTVEDDSFWEGVEPVVFGSLPQLQDAVTVVGYPIGGDTMSVTSGVVSRIEVTSYVHGAAELLGIQIDAAVSTGSVKVVWDAVCRGICLCVGSLPHASCTYAASFCRLLLV